MSKNFQLPAYCWILLPIALSQTMLTPSVHASETWVPTNTHAAIRRDAKSEGFTLVAPGHPMIHAAQIRPMGADQTLHIAVNLKQRHAEQLQALLREINQPGNPNYHHYLTPAQFKAQYAPTDAQAQAVVAYLRKFGFKNIQVAPNNLQVIADGDATSANAAFNTAMQTFTFEGKQHFANATDATVPPSLGDVVSSVQGLQDISMPHTLSHLVAPQQDK